MKKNVILFLALVSLSVSVQNLSARYNPAAARAESQRYTKLYQLCRNFRPPAEIDLMRFGGKFEQQIRTCLGQTGQNISNMKSRAGNLVNNFVHRFKAGNEGWTRVNTLSYNWRTDEIHANVTSRARQVWKNRIQVPYNEERCIGTELTGYTCRHVPVGFRWETKTTVVYSLTCTWDSRQTFRESTPRTRFNCNAPLQSRIGINTTAFNRIMNGEAPTLSQLLSVFRFDNGAFAETITIDTAKEAAKALGRFPGTVLHLIASDNFLETFSVENGVSEAILAIGTAGASVSTIPNRVAQMLRGEAAYLANSIRSQGFTVVQNEVYNLMRRGGGLDNSGRLHFQFRFNNYPKRKLVCFAKRTRCLREVYLDRLGFEILVTRR